MQGSKKMLAKLIGLDVDSTEEDTTLLVVPPGETLDLHREVKGREEHFWKSEHQEDGELSVDVYETPTALVVKSTISGVKPENLHISLNHDMLTIRGQRDDGETSERRYLCQECFWGTFSRSIILPLDVDQNATRAFLRNGVLTITMPKVSRAPQLVIEEMGE